MLSNSLTCIAIGVLFANSVQSALLTNPSQLSPKGYDFIIVGGGTAGLVVANRLSEDAGACVLVIEAGISNTEGPVANIQIPFLASAASPNTPYDWNFTTTPQKALNNRSMTYPRGFVLGGSSSINNLVYSRGSSDEYNHIAQVSGDPGWAWNNVFKYALKSERHVISADRHNETGEFIPAFHGHGPLESSLPGFSIPLDDKVITATKQLSSEFPFNEDVNSGSPLGIGWLQATVGQSVRSSSATAYLAPIIGIRTNLDVLIHTYATRLIQTGSTHGTPIFLGVEIAQSRTGPRTQLKARKEVVLSSGAVGTPQLLMVSGIGPKQILAKVGIKTIVDVPDVGQNLQDQPFITLIWSVASNNTLDSIFQNPALLAQVTAEYETNKTGPFAMGPGTNQIGFLRLPDNSPIIEEFGDPSAGPNSPHYEFAFSSIFVGTNQPAPLTGHFMTGVVVLVSPTSRGSITLNSSSLFDHPLINLNFLDTQFDVLTLIEATKAMQRFAKAPVFNNYIIGLFGDSAQTNTDAEIETYLKNEVVHIKHTMSTARISKTSDKFGVVGPDLLVKNVQGLRIVDASILPKSIGAHPQATVYIVAERGADLIKESHGIPIS